MNDLPDVCRLCSVASPAADIVRYCVPPEDEEGYPERYLRAAIPSDAESSIVPVCKRCKLVIGRSSDTETKEAAERWLSLCSKPQTGAERDAVRIARAWLVQNGYLPK